MKLSEQGAKLLIEREGTKLKAYKDSVGVWTIGVGHTGPEVVATLRWTQAQADEAFAKDVQWAVDTVNKTGRPLEQFQFDALVSFTFNVGASAYLGSTLRKKLLNGQIGVAAEQFDRWHIPEEIISRRNAEKLQFQGREFVARKS